MADAYQLAVRAPHNNPSAAVLAYPNAKRGRRPVKVFSGRQRSNSEIRKLRLREICLLKGGAVRLRHARDYQSYA